MRLNQVGSDARLLALGMPHSFPEWWHEERRRHRFSFFDPAHIHPLAITLHHLQDLFPGAQSPESFKRGLNHPTEISALFQQELQQIFLVRAPQLNHLLQNDSMVPVELVVLQLWLQLEDDFPDGDTATGDGADEDVLDVAVVGEEVVFSGEVAEKS